MATSFLQPPIATKKKCQLAYEGARFDLSGYCLKHPTIRLCKPANVLPSKSLNAANDERVDCSQAKYVIVRKISPMCGEHSLRNDRKLNKLVRCPDVHSLDYVLTCSFLSNII
jgi:hypothetical protein